MSVKKYKPKLTPYSIQQRQELAYQRAEQLIQAAKDSIAVGMELVRESWEAVDNAVQDAARSKKLLSATRKNVERSRKLRRRAG